MNEKWKELMANTPITITLYGANDEEKRTYSRAIIPWGTLKRAIRLTKSVNQNAISEGDMDAIAGLVVEAFGEQFTLDELDKGADIGEMLVVLENIVSRAGALVKANPTNLPPSNSKKKLR